MLVNRPNPNKEDLTITAQALCTAQTTIPERIISTLAEAYDDIYKKQKTPDFWGLRDFYHLIKQLSRELATRKAASLDQQMVINAVSHNFSGQPPPPNTPVEKLLDNENVAIFMRKVCTNFTGIV